MSNHRLDGIMFLFGSSIAVIGYLLPESQIRKTAWIGLAGSYLLAGFLYGGSRYISDTDTLSFIYAMIVALLSALIPAGIRLSDILSARPEFGLIDVFFMLWEVEVLVPVTVAFMTPLGVAKSRMETSVTTLILVLPYLAGSYRTLSTPGTFGLSFILFYHSVLLFVGVIAGLPLYLYGRRFK